MGRPFAVPSAIGHQPHPDPTRPSRRTGAPGRRIAPAALGAAKPTLQLPALLSRGLLQYAAADLVNRQRRGKQVLAGLLGHPHNQRFRWRGCGDSGDDIVSGRLRLTGQPCSPAPAGGSNSDRLGGRTRPLTRTGLRERHTIQCGRKLGARAGEGRRRALRLGGPVIPGRRGFRKFALPSQVGAVTSQNGVSRKWSVAAAESLSTLRVASLVRDR